MSELFGLFLLQDGGQAGPAGLLAYVPLILVFVVFYFFLIRPQQKERQRIERETQEMLASLKQGDKIVTSGGILGTIVAVRDDTVQLKIADGVKVDVLKSAVARRTSEVARAQDAK